MLVYHIYKYWFQVISTTAHFGDHIEYFSSQKKSFMIGGLKLFIDLYISINNVRIYFLVHSTSYLLIVDLRNSHLVFQILGEEYVCVHFIDHLITWSLVGCNTAGLYFFYLYISFLTLSLYFSKSMVFYPVHPYNIATSTW